MLDAAPTVDAGGPYDVVEGGSVVVSATGPQPDGQALTYRWDLDDNGTFETPGQSVDLLGGRSPGAGDPDHRSPGDGPDRADRHRRDDGQRRRHHEDFAFDGFRDPQDLPDVNEANLGTQFT